MSTVAKSGSYEDLINKPTIPDITGLATETYVDNKVADYTKTVDLADVAKSGSYNDLADKPTIPSLDGYAKTTEIPTKVSVLTNDSNYQTADDVTAALAPYAKSADVSTEITTEIAKVVADAPESLNTLKEMSDWIAGHEDDASAMNSAISDNKTAITALQTGKADKSEIPTTVAELTDSSSYAKKTDLHSHTNKSVLDGITEEKVASWDNKSEFSGSYNDLNDKPTIDAELSNTSENAIQNKVVTKEINKLYSDISFNDFDTATDGISFTDAEDGNMLVTDCTKNLLNPTFETTTHNGITCTNNGDGTYTLNGTASGNTYFNINTNISLEVGKEYKIVGCKDNKSSYYSLVVRHESVNDIIAATDANTDFIADENNIIMVYVYVNNGIALDNVIIKPMLTTDLSATYDNFVPYSGYDIKTCGKNIVGNPSNRNSPTVKDGVVTFPAKSAATEDTYLRLYTNVDISAFDTFRVVVESINCTINDSHRSYVIIKTAGKKEFSTWYPTSFESSTNKYISNVFNCSDFGNKIEEITVVVKKGYAYPGGSYKVSVFNGKDKEFSNWVKYVESSVHIDSTTEFPLLGLKSFDGETNIISPGNVEVTYAKSDSGKGVLDSLYNKDKMLTEQNDSLSVIGKCKNLLNPTFDTDTHNGITFTRNDDGTYSLSGSRTDTSISAYTTFVNNFPLEKGKYKLTGAVDENNYIRCIIKKSASENINIYDYGDGCILDVNETGVTIALLIVSTDDTSQIRIIKPMLTTNLNATYDDFVPYTGDGETLTSDVAEIRNDLGGLTFSASGTTLTITDGTHTWTLQANS